MKIKEHLLIVSLFILLTIFVTYPLIWQLSSVVFDLLPWDPLIFSWMISSNVERLFSQPLDFFQTNIFYPYQNTLAYSENLIGTSFLVLPIIKIFNNPILAHNLALLLSFIITGYGMFLLLFYLTKNKLAAFLGALFFTFAPYRILRMTEHLNVISSQWLPFTFLYLHKFFDNKKIRDAIFFTFFFILQILTAFVYLPPLILAVSILIIVKLFSKKNIFDKKIIRGILIAFIIIVCFLVPFLKPYFQLQKEQVISRTINSIIFYSPTPQTYITPWYFFSLDELAKNFEKLVFPGVMFIFLVALGLCLFRKNKKNETKENKQNFIIYIVIGLIGLFLSLGPLIKINGFYIYGLYYPLLSLPGFGAIRTTGRFMILFLFVMTIAAGLGLKSLFPEKNKQAKKILLVLIILFLLEISLSLVPLRSFIKIPTNNEIPAVYQWLKKEPGDFVILEWPMLFDYQPDISSLYAYFSTYHHKKMVNGDSSNYPPTYLTLTKIFHDFPDEASKRIIRILDVKYIIVHKNFLAEKSLAIFENKIKNDPDIILVKSFGHESVYQLKK